MVAEKKSVFFFFFFFFFFSSISILSEIVLFICLSRVFLTLQKKKKIQKIILIFFLFFSSDKKKKKKKKKKSNMKYPNIKTLVFDVSGVLRDSKRIMEKSYIKAFHEANVPVNFDINAVYKLRGLQDFNDLRNSIRLLVATKGEVHESVVSRKGANKLLMEEMRARQVPEELVEKIRSSFRREFSSDENRSLVSILPGVESGLKILQNKYTLAVLSNSTQKSLDRDLGQLSHHFTFMIPDAEKPDPSVLLRTLSNNNIIPGETAYIGDALSDIDLAVKSGTYSISLLTGMGTEKHVTAASPDVICRDFNHLVASLT